MGRGVKVHAYASLDHYWRHIEPIWNALPPERRGVAVRKIIELPADGMTLVASYVDLRMTDGREAVYVEHGAGQSYHGDPRHRAHPSYSGSAAVSYRHVRLFVCPNDQVAQRWSERWPDIQTVVVGCPKMDERLKTNLRPIRNMVAWTWHWPAQVCPETQSAIYHYVDNVGRIVEELRRAGFDVMGHAHPRWGGTLQSFWKSVEVEFTPRESDVFDKASILIVDNSSLAYEFASLGRPVVSLNTPSYRRDVDHGLRFWDAIPGLQCDEPDEVVHTVLMAAEDGEMAQALRRRAVAKAYGYVDGEASRRAVDAIMNLG